MWPQQASEARLLEVMVGRDCRGYAEFLHNQKAGAINQAEVFVPMSSENGPASGVHFGIDMHDPDPWGTPDTIDVPDPLHMTNT